MLYEAISIQAEGSAPDTKLYIYILDSPGTFQQGENHPMIILCPGGSYEKTSDRESEPIAMKLLAMGYHVGILRYSVAPARFPTALFELAEVMKLVRINASKWHVKEDAVFVQGSSAGGHLAASLGVFWNQPFLYEKAGVEPAVLKPAGLILNYPVITSRNKYTHEKSMRNLLGEHYNEKKYRDLKKLVSIEKQVSEEMPPCFIWHTFTDQTVPVENSLFLAEALCKAHVSTELHIYPVGEHGLSLADETTVKPDGSKYCEEVQSWIDLLEIWLKGICKKIEMHVQ